MQKTLLFPLFAAALAVSAATRAVAADAEDHEHMHHGDASAPGQGAGRAAAKDGSAPSMEDLTRRLQGLPDSQAAQLRAFVRQYADDPQKQALALEKALEAAEATRQLIELRELREQNRISEGEFSRQQNEVFRKLDAIMLEGMPRDMHRSYMRHMRGPLKELDYNLSSRHADHWKSRDPSSDSYTYGAGVSQSRGYYQQAAEQARQAIVYDANNVEAHGILMYSSYKMNDIAQARASAERILQLDRGNVEALSMLKTTREAAPDPRTADAGAPHAIQASAAPLGELQPSPAGRLLNDDDARRDSFSRASADYFRSRDFSKALKNANEALRLDPSDPTALYIRAMVRMREGAYKDSLRDLDFALQRAPENAQLLTARALALNWLHQYPEALREAEKSLRVEKSANGYFAKAWALAGLGRREEALEALTQAAKLNPSAYEKYRSRLAALPEDADLDALFRGTGAAAAAAAPAPAPSNKRFLLYGVMTLVGGFLLALALLDRRVARVLSQIRRREPSSVRPVGGGNGPVILPSADPGGQVIAGAYRVMGRLGGGGMGVVYEAIDEGLGRKVAIKRMREEIRDNPHERQRFLREARTVAALRHPNIVEIYSIVEEGSDVYLVFELVDGKTAQELVNPEKPATFRQAMDVMRGTCAALEYAHARNIIHRDLKPSNVMIDGRGHVRVMDFGVARETQESMTRLAMTNTVVGTPPYMAPEQEQGQVRKESDIYALAVCLYELVTGRLPFTGIGAGMLLSKMQKNYTPASRYISTLPAGFDGLMERVLEPDPEKRRITAAKFLRDLEGLKA